MGGSAGGLDLETLMILILVVLMILRNRAGGLDEVLRL